MSIFSKPKAAAKPQPLLVAVNYRDLGPDPYLNRGGAYVYKWTLPVPPAVGTWAWVTGWEGQTTAVVCDAAASVPPGFKLAELKTVLRLVSERDLKRAGA